MGSSRSAGCCRSPHRPTMRMSPSAPIRPGCRRGRSGMMRLKPEVRRVFEENFGVYGVRKVWRQLKREGHRCCPLHGGAADANHGFAGRDPRQAGQNHDQRQGGAVPAGPRQSAVPGAAPNALWVSDFTYVATWAGFVYVAFVIDAYARRIVGWRVSADGARRLRARCAGAGSA